jgi:chemotaxis protein methyltransferase CheR
MTINEKEFLYIADFIKNISGISLSNDKGYLVESRLMPILRKHDLENYETLVKHLSSNNRDIINDTVEALTTNETSFFRDLKPFQFFEQKVAELCKTTRDYKIRIWSAACSTGQEPYSIAINLMEKKEILNGKDFEIVATDIDSSALKRAEQGNYTQFEVQRGMPITLLMKYFTQSTDSKQNWNIRQDIKNSVRFQKLNLLDDYYDLGNFDFIFCRNVLIYFEQSTKSKILHKFSDSLKQSGVLFLGGSETIINLTDRFEHFDQMRSAYKIKEAPRH